MFGEDDGLKRFTTPPVEEQVIQNTEAQPEASAQPTDEAPVVETPAQPAGEQKADTFIEDLNKRFGTSFKADEDVKGAFGLQQKIADLEPKLTDYSKKIEDYEKQIENLKSNDYSGYLDKPLVRKAYVAEQLLAKYPDKDPFVLQEIVMTDVEKMGDLDVLVKNQKINHPKLGENDIKAVLFKKYGIDPETNPTEWDSIAKTEIAMDAESARANIKALTTGIEMPKTASKEELATAQQAALQKRITDTAPIKDEFVKFDKFTDPRIEGFDYDVPNDYKSKLGDMFQAMVINAGMEMTPENKEALIELRDSLLIKQELPKIWDIAFKKGQVSVQKKVDEDLHNDKLPNTATRTDVETDKNDLPGPSLSAFLENNR
jgi:hypothetical protein